MEIEELTKLVDGIYKNILDKFNPGARQMINAGKTYLKALHGAAAASRIYVDAITKLARQAQQGTWGGSSDIGAALMKIVEVYKEIQEQQMNILKAFYVDLLVPLETNLEKDTKVVQSEQKKFLQQHKQRSETYSKAAAMMKKQRKKSRGSTKTGIAMDKELKNMQVLEEEKTKLDAFCEQSLKTAMTQERRRYGFVLERQCSLAKHYLSYHNQGLSSYQQNIDEWNEVAKTREFLPETVENMFTSRMRQVSFWPDEDVYSNPRSPKLEDDRLSISSQLRKTKSMDASCLDIRSIGDASSPMLSLSRAKSDFNLTASTHSLLLAQDCETPIRRPKSIALPSSQPPQWDIQLARSLYAYLSSGENQLSFLEGDIIALMGDRNKGWQFGENLRTQCSGWFPLAYTEILDDPTISPSHRYDASGSNPGHHTPAGTLSSPSSAIAPSTSSNGHNNNNNNTVEHLTPRMFGDTLHLHRSSANAKQIRRVTGVNNYIPPPALPAPVPTPQIPTFKQQISQTQSGNFAPTLQYGIKTSNSTQFQNPGITQPVMRVVEQRPPPMPPLPVHLQATKPGKIGPAVGNVSLHSSNDSGFSNDPPPQPEADYSDDEAPITKVPIRKSIRSIKNDDNNNKTNERKTILKRTKSFWRFGKYNSDSEILEGMSLWKHRDLVDVTEIPITVNLLKKPETPENTDSIKSDQSIDSDRTLNAKQFEETGEEIYGNPPEIQRTSSVKKSAKLSLPVRKNSDSNNIDFENHFQRSGPENYQFYDDDGDGLIMRTVNRKDILKQYDSTDIESDSEIISDDPYDCIVVDDHTQKKGGSKRSNVAEIGKKLEQFSKSNKYFPDKETQISNGRNIDGEIVTIPQEHNKHSFTTFGIDENKSKTPQPTKRNYSEKEQSGNFEDTSGDETTENNNNNRQFLPRTKLAKNNNGPTTIQSVIKYEQEIVEYGDGNIKKHKTRGAKYEAKYEDVAPNHGNIYGPWYDLWGLDATVAK